MRDFLSDVESAKAFYLNTGGYLHNVFELRTALLQMESSTFNKHVNPDRNDFAAWIKESIGDEILADLIKPLSDPKNAAVIVGDRIKELERISEVQHSEVHQEVPKEKFSLKPLISPLLLIIALTVIILSISLTIQQQYAVKAADLKLSYRVELHELNESLKHTKNELAFLNHSLTVVNSSFDCPSPVLKPLDLPSPADHIQLSDISVKRDAVEFRVALPEVVSFEKTKSMDPLFDREANAIEIVPLSKADIHIGDIIAYKADDDILVHRVINMSSDTEGWYVIAKGDNLAEPDPKKVRFEDIKGIVVAIIY